MRVAIGPFQFTLPENFDLRSAAAYVRHLPLFVKDDDDPSAPMFRVCIVDALEHPPPDAFRRVGNTLCLSDHASGRQIFITDEMKSMIDWEKREMHIEPISLSADPEFDTAGKVMVQLRLLVSFATLRCGGVPLHCSCVGKEGRAALFFGPSGAGKSTIALMMMKNGWQLLNDEYNLLIPDGQEGYRAFSTPFSRSTGKPGNPADGIVAGGLFGLRHGSFSATDLTTEKAVRALIGSVYMLPDFAVTRGLLLDTVAEACSRLPVRDLRFGISDDTAERVEALLLQGRN